jgi:hypothetical protein
MHVDLGGLDVGVAKELLDRADGLAAGGQSRTKRVPEIVETNRADTGSPTCCLESLGHLRAVERVAGLRMREDEVLVRRVAAAT